MDTARGDPFTTRLPPELLCATFTYLSLGDAIAASHVSRYWRETALATPQLWATIRRPCQSARDFEIITTLLSRSGSIADIAVLSYYPSPDSAFDALVRPYIHKIRSLDWFSHIPISPLCDAAPCIETLLFKTSSLDIQPNFLGGGPGALRTLRCARAELPIKCPSLSSVVSLRIDVLQIDPAHDIPHLFDMCPWLQVLHIGGLEKDYSRVLLSGAPPDSLRALTLKSGDPDWDAMQHFVGLHTSSTRFFSLDVAASHRGSLGAIPDLFLRGATALSIREPYLADGSWLVATLPDAREHSLAVPELCVPSLARRIVQCGSECLRSVHTLNITVDVLEHFVAVAAAVPVLEHVSIELEILDTSLEPRHPGTHVEGWDALVYAQAVLDAAPQLRSLQFHARNSWHLPGAEINARDARLILSHLRFLALLPAPVPDVRVTGFPAAAIRGLDMAGLPVRFDTVESFGVTPFWPFEAEYKK